MVNIKRGKTDAERKVEHAKRFGKDSKLPARKHKNIRSSK